MTLSKTDLLSAIIWREMYQLRIWYEGAWTKSQEDEVERVTVHNYGNHKTYAVTFRSSYVAPNGTALWYEDPRMIEAQGEATSIVEVLTPYDEPFCVGVYDRNKSCPVSRVIDLVENPAGELSIDSWESTLESFLQDALFFLDPPHDPSELETLLL